MLFYRKYAEKVENGVEENLGKLGIMDFFNVLFTGAFFVICISWIVPCLWKYYVKINQNFEYESYVGIVVLFYIVGIILQELGSYYDNKYEHIKSNVLEYFLKEEAILNKAIKQDCLKALDMLFFFFNALSPLFFYSTFYFSYSFLKT